MIGRLRGTLAHKGVEGVLIDVGGVGYEVQCPLTTLDRLPPEGQACTLTIHTHVREDVLTLFGFGDAAERALFRSLTGVSGVGPKLALACLSGMDGPTLTNALAEGDVKRLSTIPGIGKRTAERLVLELKEKVGRSGMPGRPAPTAGGAVLADLESALCNLGYKPKDVEKLIAGLAADAAGQSFEALLREALRRLNG